MVTGARRRGAVPAVSAGGRAASGGALEPSREDDPPDVPVRDRARGGGRGDRRSPRGARQRAVGVAGRRRGAARGGAVAGAARGGPAAGPERLRAAGSPTGSPVGPGRRRSSG